MTFRPEIYDTPEERAEAFERFSSWEEEKADADRERWLEREAERIRDLITDNPDPVTVDSKNRLVMLVCSNRPRPQLHSGRKDGAQWWSRDVHHLSEEHGKTLCGVNAESWLEIERQPMSQAVGSHDLCKRCQRILNHK